MRFVITLLLLWSLHAASQSVGSRVSFTAVDGKAYTGTIREINGTQYRIAYDGVNFEAWLSAGQFKLVQTATSVPYYQTSGNSQDLQNIFNFGKSRGWTGLLQESSFRNYTDKLSEKDKSSLVAFLNQAKTPSAKFFVLKSLLSGDSFTTLQRFIGQLNDYPENVQQEKCLITNHRSIIQQWEYSCSVTTVQTYLGDLCPRYAWEVKQISNYDKVANDPKHPMAQQQKQLLEYYGGGASPRGDYSGKVIGINDCINQLVGAILGVRFYHQQITEDLSYVLPKIRAQMDNGFDVPLLINFVGTAANHFILAMRYRIVNGAYQYLIYDPWDGVCDYVSESTLLQGSLSPLLSQWKIKVLYYYPTTQMTQQEINDLYSKRKQTGF